MARIGARGCTAIAAMVAVTACGGSGGTPRASTHCALDELAKLDKPVEITFWHSQSAQLRDILPKLVARFESQQQAVRVKLVEQADYDDTIQRYRAGLSTGALPDLVQTEETTIQLMIDSARTLPVQVCADAAHLDRTDYVARALDYYTVQGTLRAMPWNVSNPVLFYNAAAFERAGLDPSKPPRTLDDVREYSRRIVATGAAKTGIALKIEPFYLEHWFAKAGEPYVDHGGGRDARATKVLFDNATGRRIFTWWHDMLRDHLAMSTAPGKGSVDNLLAIGTGDAAMAIEASSGLGPVMTVLSSGQYQGVRLAVGPMPGVRSGGGVPVGDGALWIVRRGTPVRQAAAWRFAEWLDRPEQQADLHVATGYIPIRRSVVDAPAVRDLWARQPAYRVGYDQLQAGSGNPAANGSVIGAFLGVRDAVRDGLTAMVAQGVPPADALGMARAKADEAIRAYNARLDR